MPESTTRIERPLISPCDCRHPRMLMITETLAPGDRDLVQVCADCGEFQISGRRGDEHFRLAFNLATDRSVEAAGRYARFLREEESPAVAETVQLEGDWTVYDPPRRFDSFRDDSLVGCLIRVISAGAENAQPTEWLVGEINARGGVCECCENVNRGDMVIASRRIYRLPE